MSASPEPAAHPAHRARLPGIIAVILICAFLFAMIALPGLVAAMCSQFTGESKQEFIYAPPAGVAGAFFWPGSKLCRTQSVLRFYCWEYCAAGGREPRFMLDSTGLPYTP